MNIITLVNIGVVCSILFFMFSGFRQGFMLKLLGIFSFFVLGFLAWYLSAPLASFISLYPKEAIPDMSIQVMNSLLYDNLNRITLFVVLFLLFSIIILIIRPALKFLNHIPVVSIVNRIAGCFLGLLQGVLILILVSMFLRFPLWTQGTAIVENSYLKHCEPISKVLFFYTKEPIQELQKFKDSIDEQQAFTKEEADNFYQWLLKQQISKENADQIISTLRVE